jgi:hypothetical protein
MTGLVIEQTQDEIKLALQVHKHAAIESVRVASAKWKSLPPDQQPDGPIRLAFHRRSKHSPSPPGTLRIEILFRTEGTTNEVSVFSVESTFEVDYSLEDGFEIAPAQIKAFKDGNAIFNAWPYYREFLQSAVQRMALPPLAAPFMRVQTREPRP